MKMHHFDTPKVGVFSVAPTSKVRASATLLLQITEEENLKMQGGIATA
jgi:hypothetical protein